MLTTDEEVAAYLATLRRALAGEAVDSSGPPHPLGDPIVLHDLDVVHDREYPELRARFELEVTPQNQGRIPPELLGVLEARCPFEPGWMHLCGYDDMPGLYFGGPFTNTVDRMVRARIDARRPDRADPEEVVAAAPPEAELWAWLLARLAEEGDVSQPEPGVLLVDRGTPEPLTVLVTPAQWRRSWALHVRARQERMERRRLVGEEPEHDECEGCVPPDPDTPEGRRADGTNIGHPEPFLVFHEDRLQPSVRAALPPVSAETAWAVEFRRRESGARWLAYTPLSGAEED